MRRLKIYRYFLHTILPNNNNKPLSKSTGGPGALIINNNNNNTSANKLHVPYYSLKTRGKRKSPSIRKSLIFGAIIFSLYFFFIGLVSFLALSSNSTGGDGPGRRRIKTISFGTNNKNQTFFDSYSSYVQMSQLGLVPLRSQGTLLSDILRSQGLFKCVAGGVHFRKSSKDKKGSSFPPQPPVGLISFPGSGNTWLRYLLQSSTGIYTGSVYKDFALLRNGFPGESITDSRVLVVKTHEYGPKARSAFQKIILLLRKPREAILAEFNRLSAGHVGVARKEMYFINNGDNWSYFVDQKGKDWRETYLDWINNFRGELFLVVYSSLVQNTLAELKSILKFLEIPVSPSILQCVMKHKDGIYKRRHSTPKESLELEGRQSKHNNTRSSNHPHPQPFNPFTPKMDKYLWAQEQIVIQAIRNRTRQTLRTHPTNNTQKLYQYQKQLKILF